MAQFKSFSSYITDEVITRAIVKERAKYTKKIRKHSSKYKSPDRLDQDPLWNSLARVMPPRRMWHNLGSKMRRKCRTKRELAERSILVTIALHRKDSDKCDYINNLNTFCDEIRETALNRVVLNAPDIAATYKKFKYDQDTDAITIIFRPTCVYRDLKAKVLIKLACDYLMQCLDSKLHEEILAYRLPRNYHGEHPDKFHTTERGDAIKNIKEFRKAHGGEQLWVSECDIQKFFDIVNHDTALKCFEDLIGKHYNDSERQQMQPAINILEAYFNSYSFKSVVMPYNDDEEYWKSPKRTACQSDRKLRELLAQGKKQGRKLHIKCCFDWVKEEDFLNTGGYTPQSLDYDKIGIPQGGALSTLVANVVLNSVDQCIVGHSDDNCLFNRFGDDIILIHNNEETCRKYITAYNDALTAHHLVFHEMHSVSEFKREDHPELIDPGFWDAKSKYPFAWEPGEGNKSQWLGFLGYEIDFRGDLRLRKSTYKKKFVKLCREYNVVINANLQGKSVEDKRQYIIKSFNKVVKKIMKDNELVNNKFTRKQAHNLDRYRHRKMNKAIQLLLDSPRFDKRVKNGSCSFASCLKSTPTPTSTSTSTPTPTPTVTVKVTPTPTE